MKGPAIVFLFLIVCFSTGNAYSADSKSKDSVTCAQKALEGTPDTERIDKLNNIVTKASYQSTDIAGYHQAYCLKFEHVSNTYMFKKDILEAMKKTPYGIEKLWTLQGCSPKSMGATDSPLIHLVAEDVGGKTQFFLALHKYLLDQKDEKTWLKIVNAKSSRGHTMLDYIVYLTERKVYLYEEIESVNNLIKLACEKGAVFSAYDRKCPTEITNYSR